MPALTYVYGAVVGIGGIFGYAGRSVASARLYSCLCVPLPLAIGHKCPRRNTPDYV